MRLKVLLPSQVLVDREVQKVGAESVHGAFVVLPRHIDFAASLTPGLLAFTTATGEENFLAVDEGICVKCGDELFVATGNAIFGPALEDLRAAVEEQFRTLDQQERKARTALARLEADFIRRYLELGF
jgi:F-type H+-transporting ATPase subunit epsilon